MFIDVDQMEPIVADIRLGGVQFTGSTNAGRKVGALAGKHLKRVCLELGGSDAFIVLDDVDTAVVWTPNLLYRWLSKPWLLECSTLGKFALVPRGSSSMRKFMTNSSKMFLVRFLTSNAQTQWNQPPTSDLLQERIFLMG